MDYRLYLSRLRSQAGAFQLSEYGSVLERGLEYPLVRLALPGRSWLVLTSGFHGEEQAGPLTIAEHLPQIAEAALALGVGLRIYPCINPSGFEAGTRYNASGERPNNDFLRYEVAPGVWKGELRPGEPFLSYRPHLDGPKETRALLADLEAHPAPRAALDLHQDNYMPRQATYAFVFGEGGHFLRLVRASSAQLKVAVHCAVDELHRTDRHGLVRFHDGSITDYFFRRGVTLAAALETTTRTPLSTCHAVNLIWILGLIELCALEAQPSQK